jgi:hypothetical protein
VRLSEAENAYKTKLRDLEQQFESKAVALREAYFAAVLEIHEVATSFGNNHLHRFRSIASGALTIDDAGRRARFTIQGFQAFHIARNECDPACRPSSKRALWAAGP